MEFQDAMELKIAFFKDLDVNAVRKSQENFKLLQDENHRAKNKLTESQEIRRQLFEENK